MSRAIRIIIALLSITLIPSYAISQIEKGRIKLKQYSDTKKKIPYTTIINFDKKGDQVTRFNTVGDAIDAHDGEIALFNNVYYLYGTSYDCGFAWRKKDAAFCGFKVYSSGDMVNWTDKGFLFDAKTPVWQTRCNGNTYGCFRPHVIFNKKTGLYVLWINVYDNRVGFRVFTSKSPIGPFTEVAVPTLAVNSDSAIAGLNNGDHDTFVDDDGTAYIAYTDWRTKGTIVIEKLNPDYLSGTGLHVKGVTAGQTEAPSLFKRHDKYYVLYSDPNCGYCSGTGTSYKTAASPLGPWSGGVKISDSSCGGQPSFVSAIKLSSDTIFLFGSDLWNKGARNEALANYYWSPLTFASDGSINPIICQDTVRVPIVINSNVKQEFSKKDVDNTSGNEGFRTGCDVSKNIQRSQAFAATRTGVLTSVSFTTFKNNDPDAPLKIEIFKAGNSLEPSGQALSSTLVLADSIGWAPKNILINPKIPVIRGKRYCIVVSSTSSAGCYGYEYNDFAPYPGDGETYSVDGGKNFSVEKSKSLKFQTFIH